jgi:hypothetical protein
VGISASNIKNLLLGGTPYFHYSVFCGFLVNVLYVLAWASVYKNKGIYGGE